MSPCWDLLEAANDEHGRNNFRHLLGEDQIWYVTSMSPLAFFQKGKYAAISPWQFLPPVGIDVHVTWIDLCKDVLYIRMSLMGQVVATYLIDV